MTITFSLFEDNVTTNFETIYQKLNENLDCTYISYALESSNGQRVHYYSNHDWQETFIKEKLINDCPLLKFARDTNTQVLPWNILSSNLTTSQKRVMEARDYHNIGNGIGMQQNFFDLTEMVTFASYKDNTDFVKKIVENKSLIKKYVIQMRTIALASMLLQGNIDESAAWSNKISVAETQITKFMTISDKLH